MNIRKSAPTVLIAAVIVMVVIVSVVSNYISHRMVTAFEEAQFSMMGQIVQSKLQDAEKKAISAAELVAAMPAVKKAFAAGKRDELLATTLAAYKIQHDKYGLSQAQFHTAPATSFLRVHNPEKFGDDQISYRKIVAEVNESNAIRKGVEITTSGIGIFGTLPMTDEAGKPTGSFEMGLEFGPVLDELKKSNGFEVALFIDEKMLQETATALKGDVFNSQNRTGRFVKFHSTHPELSRALVLDGDIEVRDDSSYIREAGGVPYGVLLQPVYNYTKKQIGVIAVVRSFAATRSADGQSIVWQTMLGLISIIMLSGMVLVVIRGMVLRPVEALTERVTALANGVQSEPMPDEALCDELKALSEQCEALAARKASGKAGDAT
jgi:methyl-accepting chemotaxis protein